MQRKINYPLATTTWDQAEIDAIQKVVDTGMYSMGKYVSQFETEFAKYVGSKYCVMVNSGSSANLIMTAALFYCKQNALKYGDEVIVPAVSWPTTYYPLAQYGLKLKFVDIDKHTLNYDLDALNEAITDKTKLIMVVNLLGNPNDFNSIEQMVKGKNIKIIEDNCESMGAEFRGKQAGTFGEMGSFSTFFSHHMATMEGGMVVTDNEELYHILLCLRAHGWTRNLPKFNQVTGEKSDDPFEESFKFVLPGYNVRPIEMEGAIGLEQLKKLPQFLKTRRKNAKLFQELFANQNLFHIQKNIDDSSWFGFSFLIKDEVNIDRKQIVQKLMDAGIECRPIVAGNFAKNEVMKYFDYEIHGKLSNADAVDQKGFFIGNSQDDLSDQIKYLKKVIDNII